MSDPSSSHGAGPIPDPGSGPAPTSDPQAARPTASGDIGWWPYVVPMAVFLLMSSLEGWLPRSGDSPDPTWYPLAYAMKVAVVAGLMYAGRAALRDLLPPPNRVGWALAVGIGLSVAVGWVLIERELPYPKMGGMGGRQAFDPFVLPTPARWGFLAIRFLGLVVLVPVMEELFWRSFLMRWLIDPDFSRLPVGTVTPMAGGVTAALFAAAHPEWLPALLTGLAWAWLLAHTRSLAACVASHAVANLALGIYVVAARAWELW